MCSVHYLLMANLEHGWGWLEVKQTAHTRRLVNVVIVQFNVEAHWVND